MKIDVGRRQGSEDSMPSVFINIYYQKPWPETMKQTESRHTWTVAPLLSLSHTLKTIQSIVGNVRKPDTRPKHPPLWNREKPCCSLKRERETLRNESCIATMMSRDTTSIVKLEMSLRGNLFYNSIHSSAIPCKTISSSETEHKQWLQVGPKKNTGT